MTDKTMREKIAEGLHKERRRNPLPVPVGLDKTGYWLTYADAILALKVAGVPLSELIEKAKSGKLVELAEDFEFPKCPTETPESFHDCDYRTGWQDAVIEAGYAGFRRVKGK